MTFHLHGTRGTMARRIWATASDLTCQWSPRQKMFERVLRVKHRRIFAGVFENSQILTFKRVVCVRKWKSWGKERPFHVDQRVTEALEFFQRLLTQCRTRAGSGSCGSRFWASFLNFSSANFYFEILFSEVRYIMTLNLIMRASAKFFDNFQKIDSPKTK